MIRFEMFRVHLTSKQNGLFTQADRLRVYADQLQQLSDSDTLGPTGWKLGNLEVIESDNYYFKLGRPLRAKKLEALDGNRFIDVEFPQAPYTHGIFDAQQSVLAIAVNSKVAKTSQIANGFCSLIRGSDILDDLGGKISVSPIIDATELLDRISSAYQISQIRFEFSLPNPLDHNIDIEGPLHRVLKASKTTSGEISLTDPSVDKDIASEIVRSATAQGHEVSVRMKTGRKERSRLFKGGDRQLFALYSESSAVLKTATESMLEVIHKAYRRIRDGSSYP